MAKDQKPNPQPEKLAPRTVQAVSEAAPGEKLLELIRQIGELSHALAVGLQEGPRAPAAHLHGQPRNIEWVERRIISTRQAMELVMVDIQSAKIREKIATGTLRPGDAG